MGEAPPGPAFPKGFDASPKGFNASPKGFDASPKGFDAGFDLATQPEVQPAVGEGGGFSSTDSADVDSADVDSADFTDSAEVADNGVADAGVGQEQALYDEATSTGEENEVPGRLP